MKNLLVVVTTWAALSVATIPTFAAGDADAGKTKSAACVACHAATGNSILPMWPKIAGQSASYIIKQLQDFKTKQRSEPQMAPMVEPLSMQDIEDLAAYFSSQSIQLGSGKQELMTMGKKVYDKGNIDNRVIACKGCHGLNGEGNLPLLQSIGALPVVEAPAFSSQHATYIVKQLKAFKDETRNNDVGRVMRNISAGMTDQEMEAVAEYIASLH
jgi:cytochrome c553